MTSSSDGQCTTNTNTGTEAQSTTSSSEPTTQSNILPLLDICSLKWIVFVCTMRKGMFIVNKLRKENNIISFKMEPKTKNFLVYLFDLNSSPGTKKINNNSYKVKEHGSFENGMSFKVRLLFIKAFEKTLEKMLIKYNIIKFNQWFIEADPRNDYSSAFKLDYTITSKGKLCAYVQSIKVQKICRIDYFFSQDMIKCNTEVLISPCGFKGRLVGISRMLTGSNNLKKFKDSYLYGEYTKNNSNVDLSGKIILKENLCALNIPLSYVYEITSNTQNPNNSFRINEPDFAALKSDVASKKEDLIASLSKLLIDPDETFNFDEAESSDTETDQTDPGISGVDIAEDKISQIEELGTELGEIEPSVVSSIVNNSEEQLLLDNKLFSLDCNDSIVDQHSDNSMFFSERHFLVNDSVNYWGPKSHLCTDLSKKPMHRDSYIEQIKSYPLDGFVEENQKVFEEFLDSTSNIVIEEIDANIIERIEGKLERLNIRYQNDSNKMNSKTISHPQRHAIKKTYPSLNVIESEKYSTIMFSILEDSILQNPYDCHFTYSPLCVCQLSSDISSELSNTFSNIAPAQEKSATKDTNSKNLQQSANLHLNNCRCTFSREQFHWKNESPHFTSNEDINYFLNLYGNPLNPKLFQKCNDEKFLLRDENELIDKTENFYMQLKRFRLIGKSKQPNAYGLNLIYSINDIFLGEDRFKLERQKIILAVNNALMDAKLLIPIQHSGNHTLKLIDIDEMNSIETSNVTRFSQDPLIIMQEDCYVAVNQCSLKFWKDLNLSPIGEKLSVNYHVINATGRVYSKNVEKKLYNYMSELELTFYGMNFGELVCNKQQVISIEDLLNVIKEKAFESDQDCNLLIFVTNGELKDHISLLSKILDFNKNFNALEGKAYYFLSEILEEKYFLCSDLKHLGILSSSIYSNATYIDINPVSNENFTNFHLSDSQEEINNVINRKKGLCLPIAPDISKQESIMSCKNTFLKFPFDLYQENSNFSDLAEKSITVFVSYCFSTDCKYIIACITTDISPSLVRKFIEMPKCLKKDRPFAYLALTKLLILIIIYVSILNRKVNLVICRIGAILKEELLMLSSMVAYPNLITLYSAVLNSCKDSNAAKNEHYGQNMFQTSIILSLDTSQFLDIDQKMYCNFTKDAIEINPLHQTISFSYNLNTNLVAQHSSKSPDDDLLNSLTFNNLEVDNIDFSSELQEDLDFIFEGDTEEDINSNSTPLNNTVDYKSPADAGNMGRTYLRKLGEQIADKNSIEFVFIEKLMSINDENQPILSSIPLCFGTYISTVDRRLLPHWMLSPFDSKYNLKMKIPTSADEKIQSLDSFHQTMVPFNFPMLFKAVNPQSAGHNKAHALQNNDNRFVMDWILEKFNKLSYFNTNLLTGERYNGLPVHISVCIQLMQAYDNLFCFHHKCR
ncbi:MAG: Mediator of RNA polymerase II transcription subunit 13-like [Marteilia pararefringens]